MAIRATKAIASDDGKVSPLKEYRLMAAPYGIRHCGLLTYRSSSSSSNVMSPLTIPASAAVHRVSLRVKRSSSRPIPGCFDLLCRLAHGTLLARERTGHAVLIICSTSRHPIQARHALPVW